MRSNQKYWSFAYVDTDIGIKKNNMAETFTFRLPVYNHFHKYWFDTLNCIYQCSFHFISLFCLFSLLFISLLFKRSCSCSFLLSLLFFFFFSIKFYSPIINGMHEYASYQIVCTLRCVTTSLWYER